VAPAVFKTAVGSFYGSRYVRFVPSPPTWRRLIRIWNFPMTPKRKLGIAAAVLVIAAVAVLLQARDDSKKPGIAAKFLRYENDKRLGSSAALVRGRRHWRAAIRTGSGFVRCLSAPSPQRLRQVHRAVESIGKHTRIAVGECERGNICSETNPINQVRRCLSDVTGT